jgi:hypothetical protein
LDLASFKTGHKTLQHVKELNRYEKRYFAGNIHGNFSPSVPCFATRPLLVIARELWQMNQEWLELKTGIYNSSRMVAVLGGPCTIPHLNSNTSSHSTVPPITLKLIINSMNKKRS